MTPSTSIPCSTASNSPSADSSTDATGRSTPAASGCAMRGWHLVRARVLVTPEAGGPDRYREVAAWVYGNAPEDAP